DPETEMLRWSARAIEILGRRTAERPVVLVLDDLHAADVACVTLLHRLAHEIRGLRVLIIGTYREVEARRSPKIATLLARTARAGTSRPLGRLDEGTVAEWVGGVLGVAPTPALAAAVFNTTEGNPLFVDAVVQLLAARGQSAEINPCFS